MGRATSSHIGDMLRLFALAYALFAEPIYFTVCASHHPGAREHWNLALWLVVYPCSTRVCLQTIYLAKEAVKGE